jgi:hypothetical protein
VNPCSAACSVAARNSADFPMPGSP